MKHILIIDDEPCICLLLCDILRKAGFTAESTLSGITALKMIKQQQYDLVFCDYRLRDKEKDGTTLLNEIRENAPTTAVVIMTGYPDLRIAIRLIKEGAYDYLEKPFTAEKILALVNNLRGITGRPIKREITAGMPGPVAASLVPKMDTNQYVYGESGAARELYEQIALVAPTNYSVVVSGETGTGKEAVARLIHERSKRSKQPFVALDCGCLSDELAASELFGHDKGAFTGAVDSIRGAFREADGGTLFLDEIGNLSYHVQTALLRVVQERVVKPVGSLQEIPVNIRIIAASNEDLGDAVASGRFRQDLYYRLNEFRVSVPSLRDRPEDLPLFIEAFLKDIARGSGITPGKLTDEAMTCLRQYAWPGNIRELKNVIRRAVLFSEGTGDIPVACLPPEINLREVPHRTASIAIPSASVREENQDLRAISQQAEYKKIIAIMEQVKYNKTEAARLLNIDRKTLYNKLHLFNIAL